MRSRRLPHRVHPVHPVSATPRSSADSPQLRLADAVRRLTDVVVGRRVPAQDLDEVATEVARLADRLDGAAPPGKRSRGVPDHRDHPQDLFPTSPVVGFLNPVAPPVRVWDVAGRDGARELRGTARFGAAYEGPPSCVHGGVIAQLFDELLGLASVVTGQGGMTGTLTVRYRKPTPLLVDLDLEARLTSREGRKRFCWGGIFHQGELTAEAEGVFVAVGAERVMAMMKSNADQAGEQVVDTELEEYFERGGEFLGGVDGPPAR